MATNPYAPPKAQVADVAPSEVAPPLWNPSAAFYWSLLFSPIFGAWLHMKNWQALGNAEKARASRNWIIGTIVAMAAFIAVAIMLPENKLLDRIGNVIGLVLVFAWHSALGKEQRTYVKEHFGKNYERRGWLAPILTAVGCFILFVIALVLVGVMMAAAGM